MELAWSRPPGPGVPLMMVALPRDFCAQGLEVTPREPPVAQMCLRYPIDEKKKSHFVNLERKRWDLEPGAS